MRTTQVYYKNIEDWILYLRDPRRVKNTNWMLETELQKTWYVTKTIRFIYDFKNQRMEKIHTENAVIVLKCETEKCVGKGDGVSV